MKRRKSPYWLAGLFFFAWSLGVASSLVVGCRLINTRPSSDPAPMDPSLDFRLMMEAWNVIQHNYVDQAVVKPQPLTYGAIGGMVDALGDTGHSRFLTPEMTKQEHNFTEGKLEGIGAEVRMKNNRVVIVAPLDQSPAQKAGLRPGDVIIKVNGEVTTGLSLDQAVERILGPPNTSVTLTIFRPDTDRTMDVTILRARITLHNVTWSHLPGTDLAHARIASFSKDVTRDLTKALEEIAHEKMTGLILDLRNNPGGLLGEAVGSASQFLESGNVVLEKDSKGKLSPIPVESGGLALTLPMVVLVNGGTASASEIVAGALQDSHRAKVVGEKTFGTGTVLKVFSLSDGSALMLAIREWLTPAGHAIWHQGISPDFVVSLPPEATPLFPDTERGMTAKELRASQDTQLLRALDLLTQPEGRSAFGEPKSRSFREEPTVSQAKIFSTSSP